MKRKSSAAVVRGQRSSGQLSSVSTSGNDPATEIGAIVASLSSHGRAALLTHARTIRDEERRRGSRPPLMSLSLRDFVSRVQEAADDAISGMYGNKVFVAALYRMFEERGEASGCSLAEFKERLLTAQRANLLMLDRCEGLDRTDVTMTRSEIKYLGATYHVVVRRSR
jgi:hypothetical protein